MPIWSSIKTIRPVKERRCSALNYWIFSRTQHNWRKSLFTSRLSSKSFLPIRKPDKCNKKIARWVFGSSIKSNLLPMSARRTNFCALSLRPRNSHEVRREDKRVCPLLHDRHPSLADYFSFIKRLMELLRISSKMRKIHLEIQTLPEHQQDNDHPSKWEIVTRTSSIVVTFSV